MTNHIEEIYENLVAAIDGINPDKTELFLSKLALSLGNSIGDPAAVRRCIKMALDDLD